MYYHQTAGGGVDSDSDGNTLGGTGALTNLASGGTSNTAFGRDALMTVTTEDFNTAFGRNALRLNEASRNTAFGHGALDANTTATSNTAVGQNTLGGCTTSPENTAVGRLALYTHQTGDGKNTAVGFQTLYSSTTGTNNTCMGTNAGYTLTTAHNNTFMGYNSGQYLQTGNGNVAIGTQAGQNLNGGNVNTAIGYQAGSSQTSGGSNTFLGANAGPGSTGTGSNNTYIGYNASPSSNSVSNEVTIGDTSVTKFRIPGLNVEVGEGVINGSATIDITTPSTGRGIHIDEDGKLISSGEFDLGRDNKKWGTVFANYLRGNGANVNALNASNISSGTLATARMGSGSPSSSNFLRGDGTWAEAGGAKEGVFYENSQTLSSNYTVTNGSNAMAAGPITIASGVTVTVGAGETLTIV